MRGISKVKGNSWRERAASESLGQWEKGSLTWQYDPLVRLNAYYDASALGPKSYVKAYQAWQTHTQTSSPTPWRALIYHSICHSTDVHAIANMKSSGDETGLWLDATEKGCTALFSILDNFTNDFPFVGLRYSAENHNFDTPFLKHLVRQTTCPFGLLWRSGGLLGCPPKTPPMVTFPVRALALDGYTSADLSATPSEELGWLLAQAIDYLNTAAKHQLDLQAVCKSMFIVSGIGLDYFHEIAKLRAIRILLSQVASAYKLKIAPSEWYLVGIGNGNQHLHWDANLNLIRNTTQALASVIGGCDAVVVRPHTHGKKGQETPIGRHLSAQLLATIRHESELKHPKESDPSAGSFFIEHLTEALAESAWRLMQKIQAQGGCQHKKAQTWFQDRLTSNQAHSAKALASRKAILVGLNAYAAPSTPPLCSTKNELLIHPSYSSAAPYEALKAHTHAFLVQHKGLRLRWHGLENLSAAERNTHPTLSFLTEAWAIAGGPCLKPFLDTEKKDTNWILHLCVENLDAAEPMLSQIPPLAHCIWIVGHFGEVIAPNTQKRWADGHILNLSKGSFYEQLYQLVHKSFPHVA